MPLEIGYFLSSEEHGPRELLRQAQLADDAGIDKLWVSDHFHPWLAEQGESPFVWSVIGAIAATTGQSVMTAVTCPTFRIHPAIVAQAAATSAVMLEGRFELGVGSGENLNEHVLGQRWPPAPVRLEMLEEAIEVIHRLWSGEQVSHHGRHYTVEDARLYTLPDEAPPILMSGFGPLATSMAARLADGYVNTAPDAELVQQYRSEGGRGPATAGLKVCWGPDREECVKLVHHLWRSSGVPGELSQELRVPAHFDQAAQLVTEESSGEHTPCGPDVDQLVEAVREFADAGFDRLYLNQIGPNQAEFFEMYTRELGPALRDELGAPER